MALITCPECGKQVSDQAASCPGCGYPLERTQKENEQIHDIAEQNNAPDASNTIEEANPSKKKSRKGIIISLICVILSFSIVGIVAWSYFEPINKAKHCIDFYIHCVDEEIEYQQKVIINNCKANRDRLASAKKGEDLAISELSQRMEKMSDKQKAVVEEYAQNAAKDKIHSAIKDILW